MEDLISSISLDPSYFFQLQLPCPPLKGGPILKASDLKKALAPPFPSTELFHQKDVFANLGAAWSKEGLFFHLAVNQPVRKVIYPQFEKGDSLELFIDTRHLKGSVIHRFCHHFFFLPEVTDGYLAGEITRFRLEERHPHCHSDDLKVLLQPATSSYDLKVFIPADCLFGYDPEQFPLLGFAYRINRYGGSSQTLFPQAKGGGVLSQVPALWSELYLEQKLEQK